LPDSSSLLPNFCPYHNYTLVVATTTAMSDLAEQRQSFSSFSTFAESDQRDLIAELLADKRSHNTRIAYEWDLKDFFKVVSNSEPTPTLVTEFLQLESHLALAVVLKYKANLIERGLAEASVNRRLAAIKSLVNFARTLGKCNWSLQDIQGEPIHPYRDTTGITIDEYQRVLAVVDRGTQKGKRDYALLRLLFENVLRRDEVCKTNVCELNLKRRTLVIYGKGKGMQAESVSLSETCTQALSDWLETRGEYNVNSPLFIAVSKGHYGHRLTGSMIYKIVRDVCKAAGIAKAMSPHRVRHSGITAALDVTGGDVRKVQKFSRHKRLDTLMIYDDNRRNCQGEVTTLLSELL